MQDRARASKPNCQAHINVITKENYCSIAGAFYSNLQLYTYISAPTLKKTLDIFFY